VAEASHQARRATITRRDFGGIYSSTRQPSRPGCSQRQEALHLPEQYEDRNATRSSSVPPGAGAAGRTSDSLADAKDRGDEVLLAVADYIWPHTLNKKVREWPRPTRRDRREDISLDHADYSETIDKITSTGAEVVFNTIVPPGSRHSRAASRVRLASEVDPRLHVLRRELPELGAGRTRRGLYSCLDYYQNVGDPFSKD